MQGEPLAEEVSHFLGLALGLERLTGVGINGGGGFDYNLSSQRSLLDGRGGR